MPADEPLDVVIVHRDEPERCVRTGRAFLAQDVPVRITVVDNGSSEAAVAQVTESLPEADVVALGANRGFGPAANIGLKRWLERGTGAWAAVAAHDALPEPGCLRRLLDAVADRPGAGLASATYGDPMKPVVDRYFGGILVAAERDAGWEDAGHPHGTLMLAGRRCLEDVGLFDERYFAYCEEADLGERARRAGWEVGVVWDAVVRNPSMSGSSAAVEYLQLRNSLLLVRDHFGRYPAFIRLTMAIGDTAMRALWPRRRTPIFSLPARWRAIVDFGRGHYGPPPDWLLAA
jgi:N-acetylglucosaminyl-diphospho-decaprenol L-rhamnosyltransferase